MILFGLLLLGLALLMLFGTAMGRVTAPTEGKGWIATALVAIAGLMLIVLGVR